MQKTYCDRCEKEITKDYSTFHVEFSTVPNIGRVSEWKHLCPRCNQELINIINGFFTDHYELERKG